MAMTETLSPAFFHQYDELAQEAASLEEATAALKQAKLEREQAQLQLITQQREVRRVKSLIREQRARIHLVATHWFYGTTLLQPQLWFRGGCQGKIGRAKCKMAKAQDQDLPQLQVSIHQIQTERIPHWQSEVEKHLKAFELSANAATEREHLRQRVSSEHPSPVLLRLQESESDIQQKWQQLETEGENLDDVILRLFQGQKQYQQSKRHVEEAMCHITKYEELQDNPIKIPTPAESLRNCDSSAKSETFVGDGTKIVVIRNKNGPDDIIHLDKNGKILVTNFPCPNNCGHLVTWHDSHCCGACCRQGGHHGRMCQRKPISRQQGAQEKLKIMQQALQQYNRDLNREEDAGSRSFSMARKAAIQADRTVAEALTSISMSVRERCPSVCAELLANVDTQKNAHDSFVCFQVQTSDVREELEAVMYCQTQLLQQLTAVQQMQTKIRLESQALKDNLQGLAVRLDGERDRIFQGLRDQSTGTCETPPREAPATYTPPPTLLAPVNQQLAPLLEDQLISRPSKSMESDVSPMRISTSDTFSPQQSSINNDGISDLVHE